MELFYKLKNVGGVDIQNLTGILTTSSPYLTITNGSAYFGAVFIDSLIENSSSFRLLALLNAPQGTYDYLDLILSENSGVVDTVRIKIIIGKRDYFIWDPDRNNSSGPLIHSTLQNLGYVGDYAGAQFNSFEHLRNYRSLFICTGVAYENYVLFKDCYEVAKVVDFINQGGCVYLEGGECWAFDPFVMSGFNFNPYFGIKPINDGYTNMGPIEGVNNTFTQGMNFRYQGENFYLDVIDSTGRGFRIFHDQDDDYYCGVANIGNGYRTVGVSFELSGLMDNDSSTKAILFDSIMHFFGINLEGIEDLTNSQFAIRNSQLLSVYPNPFCEKTEIICRLPDAGCQMPDTRYPMPDARYRMPDTRCRISDYPVSHISYLQSATLKIYDVSGRLVKSFNHLTNSPFNQVVWFGDDDAGRLVPAGVYFVRLEAGGFRQTEKALLLR